VKHDEACELDDVFFQCQCDVRRERMEQTEQAARIARVYPFAYDTTRSRER